MTEETLCSAIRKNMVDNEIVSYDSNTYAEKNKYNIYSEKITVSSDGAIIIIGRFNGIITLYDVKEKGSRTKKAIRGPVI
jgi:ribosomal protein S6E (S10)